MEKTGTVKIMTAFLLIALCFSLVIAANSTVNQTEDSVVNVTIEDNATIEEVVTVEDSNITTEVVLEESNVTEEVVEEVAVEEVTATDPILLASYNTVKCKTNFAIALVGTIMASDSSAIYLADYASTLQKDLEQLKELVDANDAEGYSAYLKGTYEANIAKEQEAIGEWKETGSKLISAQSKNRVKADYAVIDTKYKVCVLDYVKTFGNGRVTSFNLILAAYQKKADALDESGVSTSNLDKIIADAKVEIIAPLEKAMSSSDAKSVNKAIKNYCLFDGCKDGINYHLAAKWEVAKLKLMLQRLKSQSDAEGMDKVIADLEMAIYTAESAMTYAGTNQFTADQQNQIDDSIKAGYDLVKQVIKNN